MATNSVQDGAVIEYTNAGAAISSGDVVAMNDMVGVAITDIAATTGVGSVAIEGVWSVDKIAGTAWNLGDVVDWDASLGKFGIGITTAAGDVTKCAVVTKAAASGDVTGEIKLVPGIGAGI